MATTLSKLALSASVHYVYIVHAYNYTYMTGHCACVHN